jgi:hypothetical protein
VLPDSTTRSSSTNVFASVVGPKVAKAEIPARLYKNTACGYPKASVLFADCLPFATLIRESMDNQQSEVWTASSSDSTRPQHLTSCPCQRAYPRDRRAWRWYKGIPDRSIER